MENEYAYFDQKMAMLRYKTEIQESDIFGKQKREKDEFISNGIAEHRVNSGAFFTLFIELSFKHLRERSSIYYKSIISAIEENKPISDKSKQEIIGLMSSYIGNSTANIRADVHGKLTAHGFGGSISGKSILNKVDSYYHRLIELYGNKIELEYLSWKKPSSLNEQNEKTTTENRKIEKSKSNKIKFCNDYKSECLVIDFYEGGDHTKKPIHFKFTPQQTEIFKFLYEKEDHRYTEKEIEDKLGLEFQRFKMEGKFMSLEQSMGNRDWRKLFIKVKIGQKISHWELNI